VRVVPPLRRSIVLAQPPSNLKPSIIRMGLPVRQLRNGVGASRKGEPASSVWTGANANLLLFEFQSM
jgi:hypothetical protein